MTTLRKRRVGSIADELIHKSRESALAAVQIFNNPQIGFKSEIFIVTMCIAWTYLLHAYYRKQGIEYRYFKQSGSRKIFDKTKAGAYKHWELERCLNTEDSPIDKDTANNLRFLIGLRHEIEHQMTDKIDDYLSARFQACCLNFNHYVKKLFGNDKGIDKYLAFSLQFSSMNEEQVDILASDTEIPENIQKFIEGFDGALSDLEYNSPQFAYRVLFIAKTANNKGQADKVIEFIKPDSPLAKDVNITYTLTKESEKRKYLPKNIVTTMNKEGFSRFSITNHTNLWKSLEAKEPNKHFGILVEKTWYWYDSWLKEVRKHCEENRDLYTEKKYLSDKIVSTIQEEGFSKFSIHSHTELYESKNAKEPNKCFGILVKKTWYWYESWLKEVRKHCEENRDLYT
jgi:hypothetical protein